jgi:hypothetical protein
MNEMEVRTNLVPAIAGKTHIKYFVIGEISQTELPEQALEQVDYAVERRGSNGTTLYLFSLSESDVIPLCWLGENPRGAVPEVKLEEVEWVQGEWTENTDNIWEWRRSLLGVHSSQKQQRHFTLEDGMWKRVIGYRRIGEEIVHKDYATGKGFTLRFGDGEFGRMPEEGAGFKVTYRLGGGQRGNLAANTLIHFDNSSSSNLSFVKAITNPLPVNNGYDAETAEEARQVAPYAFSRTTYRAVRAPDYAEAAERLPWVQRAGAKFRWTGSWLTAFVTPDPYGVSYVTPEQNHELVEQIDRFRQAGRHAYVAEPKYANIDLRITICVQPHAYKGDVEELVLVALLGGEKQPGFFGPDNFTFGSPLYRSQLEAGIQRVPGVKAVETMQIRWRGHFGWRPFSEYVFKVGDEEVIRLENNPDQPDHGVLRLNMEGGA